MKRALAVLLMFVIAVSLAACNNGSSTQDTTNAAEDSTYVVTFDSAGGTAIDSQIIKEGGVAVKPTDPQKEGFTFVEWQLNNTTYDFSSPIVQDLILIAFYEINSGTETVTVAFNAENNSAINTVQVKKGSAISEPPIPTKPGYKFVGWFYNNSQFDFSTSISENIVLVAKWEVDKTPTDNQNSTEKPNSNTGTNSGANSNTGTNTSTPTTTPQVNNIINFADVEGVWYAAGHDDVSITFSVIDSTWVFVEGENFDHRSCTIDMHRGTGGTDYYCDNGRFVSDCIKLSGTSSLVYTKGNNTITFYRQKNYPKEILHAHEELLQAIDGYYWYLDGYEYTYLYPKVVPWYGHKALDWESKNLYITRNEFVAYEKMELAQYWKYDIDLSASSTTHNNLLVNPIEFADSLISDYNMHVSSNKLYMTVGGTQYSFTRYTSPKKVNITLKLGFEQATVKVGERIFLPIEISPFWEYYLGPYQIEVVEDSSDDFSVAYHDRWYTSSSYPQGSGANSKDGKTTLIFYAQSVGECTLNIRVQGTQQNYQLKIKVEPQPPTNVTGVTIDKSAIELERGKTETLTAKVSPSNATNQTITWTSSDSSVATVSSSGEVTAVGKGVATITATSADGGYTATCTVTVIDPPLIVRASIGVGYYMSGSASVRGVYAEAKGSGGSGNYVEYYVKVYYNGELVAEGAENQIIVTLANGTYTAEVYVKDSNGSEATHTTEMTVSGY